MDIFITIAIISLGTGILIYACYPLFGKRGKIVDITTVSLDRSNHESSLHIEYLFGLVKVKKQVFYYSSYANMDEVNLNQVYSSNTGKKIDFSKLLQQYYDTKKITDRLNKLEELRINKLLGNTDT
jgi:hypothetical protein